MRATSCVNRMDNRQLIEERTDCDTGCTLPLRNAPPSFQSRGNRGASRYIQLSQVARLWLNPPSSAPVVHGPDAMGRSLWPFSLAVKRGAKAESR